MIKTINIKNFGPYRSETLIPFNRSTYLIGANNSGKTIILKALLAFFEKIDFSEDLLNKTEYSSRASGYNKSTITIVFDISMVKSPGLKKLLKIHCQNDETLTLTKTFTFREKSKTTFIEYFINQSNFNQENLPQEIQTLIQKITISYIHPQEGKALLEAAQQKLKNRLLLNWGRHASVSDSITQVETSWQDMRSKANSYLSSALTQSLRNLWPDCNIEIDLPESISDIVAVSNISFKMDSNSPVIPLTSQGTGAQSTILYQSHYVLDVDRSLHRGEYHPIWLIEEPESFLHADLIVKLGQLLNSSDWIDNIQMIITTHSPILLATSKISGDKILWNILESTKPMIGKNANEWDEKEIKDIGNKMGDPNFHIYFESSNPSTHIYIEDKRDSTFSSFINSGLPVTKALNGVPQFKEYLNVLEYNEYLLKSKSYFITDNDSGLKHISKFLDNKPKIESSGFQKYAVNSKVFVILLPVGYSVENLFSSFESFIEKIFSLLLNEKLEPSDSVQGNLSRAHGTVRGKRFANKDEAISFIKTLQDVKDQFWQEVDSNSLLMEKDYITILNELCSD